MLKMPKKRKIAETRKPQNKSNLHLTNSPKTPATEAIHRIKRIYQQEGYRPRTINDYIRYTTALIESAGISYIDDLTDQHIQDYLITMLDQKKKASTVNIRLASIRAVINRMEQARILNHNPVSTIRNVKEDQRPPKILTKNQVIRLFSVMDKDTFTGYRDWIMCQLAYTSGMRGIEVEQLEIKDIDFDNGIALLPGNKNKNRKVRPVPLYKKVLPHIEVLIREQKEVFGDQIQFIFNSQYGEPVKYGTFRKQLYKYAKKSGVQDETQCSPHVLRHCFAVNYLNSPNGNIRTLQLILGHSHLTTTQMYLDYTDNAVTESYRRVELTNTLDYEDQ